MKPNLDEIRRLTEAASKAPWKARDFVNVGGTKPIHTMKLSNQRSVLGSFSPEDARFIEMARTAIPELLAHIAELREWIDDWESGKL